MASGGGGDPPRYVYVYDMPFTERRSLCRILDLNDTWEELGGVYMKFDVLTLQRLGQALYREKSPTDELLTLWGTHNHTILELFVLLSKMQHYQAMKILKPLVEVKYHKLIYEGEENFSRILVADKTDGRPTAPPDQSIGKDFGIGEENVNKEERGEKWTKGEEKIVNRVAATPAQLPSTTTLPLHNRLSKSRGGGVGESGGTEVRQIRYEELEVATEGWGSRNLLGRGGFGTVYRGLWKNTQVAIKRLIYQNGDEERRIGEREQGLRELKYLTNCRHDNILPLYGYSLGGPHDCLVYQYMPCGSLEDRLLCREGSKPLDWSQRHNIARGTARGLQFLHIYSDKPLIHGDIKSANILLDPHMEPKIGDFGLAREGPLEQYTHVKVSRVHGTRPYLPDEFLRAKKFSTKVDTYSFGIVLFELATGLRAYDENRPNKFLRDHMVSLDEERLEDWRDERAGVDEGLLYPALVALGKCCVETKARHRPEMTLVLDKLNTIHQTSQMAHHARELARQNKLVSPASPYELQLLHDYWARHRSTQGGGGSSAVPQVSVQPPSSPHFSSLIPQHLQPEGGEGSRGTEVDDCLPLISALGISSAGSPP